MSNISKSLLRYDDVSGTAFFSETHRRWGTGWNTAAAHCRLPDPNRLTLTPDVWGLI